jgi:hypothetical protein
MSVVMGAHRSGATAKGFVWLALSLPSTKPPVELVIVIVPPSTGLPVQVYPACAMNAVVGPPDDVLEAGGLVVLALEVGGVVVEVEVEELVLLLLLLLLLLVAGVLVLEVAGGELDVAGPELDVAGGDEAEPLPQPDSRTPAAARPDTSLISRIDTPPMHRGMRTPGLRPRASDYPLPSAESERAKPMPTDISLYFSAS